MSLPVLTLVNGDVGQDRVDQVLPIAGQDPPEQVRRMNAFRELYPLVRSPQ